MKYLLMIYLNPASREIWEDLPDSERAEGLRAHAALVEELAASGELIVSEALADPSLAKRVSVREGRTIRSGGRPPDDPLVRAGRRGPDLRHPGVPRHHVLRGAGAVDHQPRSRGLADALQLHDQPV